MNFQIGNIILGDKDPNPGPKSTSWHLVNVVKIKEIPGKTQSFKTVRTSDVTLEECTLVVRSISYSRYMDLKLLCKLGGPYKVSCSHVFGMPMYITDCTIDKTDNDKESPLRTDDGTELLHVATWTIKLLEARD